MSGYLLRHGSATTPQSEALTKDQVENSASGFVWEVDIWTRLRRFLILGSEGGSYYASERSLTKENISSLKECIATDGPKTVQEIVAISDGGRAPSNDPALYALAMCISKGDKATKSAAAEALPQVARIGTHLYHFVSFAETMRGWGRTMRWAISNWYARNPEQLAFQAVKYRQRDGWSHRDLLRLAHPQNDQNAPLFDWIAHGVKPADVSIVEGFELAQAAKTPAETAQLVRDYRLPREALLTEHLNEADVWFAMLETGMPLGAMTRNLATMTRAGVLASDEHLELVLQKITDKEQIEKSRLHPLAILVAQRTYAQGRGFRGQNTWAPIPDVTDALDEAFYLAFDNVVPTGKRFLLALDVSGSMDGGQVCGSPLTPRQASSALALVTLHAEKKVDIVGFFSGDGGYSAAHSRRGWGAGISPLSISRRQRLDDVVQYTHRLPFGGTDCSLPFLYALTEGRAYDAVVVYTDSETWAGAMHPKEALDKLRASSGVPVRSVVVGMVSNGFTIADPNDPGMLDVVGMDTSTPQIISGFVNGEF